MSNLNEKTAELAAPAIPAALVNFPGSQTNLLPLSALQSPLQVSIERWPDSGAVPSVPVTLVLWLNGVRVANLAFQTPIDPGLFPLVVEIPENYVQQEGVHDLSYTVNTGGNLTESMHTQFTVDTTAPNFGSPGEAPQFPEEVINDGITEEYLSNHNDEVVITIPRYLQQRACDIIEFHFGLPTDEPVIKTTVHDSSSPTLIKLTSAIIRAQGPGEKFGFCRLTDRAGNRGQLSAYVRVVVHVSKR